MVEWATDRWPVDRASDSSTGVSDPEQWGGDQADRIAARIGEGRTLLAWVVPSEGDAERVTGVLVRSLADRWRVVRLSVALLAPEELATELMTAFARFGGEDSELPAPRRNGVVLLLEGGDGLLPATAGWLAAIHDRVSSTGHSIVLVGRSDALIARIVECWLPGCELIGRSPTGSSAALADDLVPAPFPAMVGEGARASPEQIQPPEEVEDEDRYWIVLPEEPEEPEETAEPRVADPPEEPEAAATVLAFPPIPSATGTTTREARGPTPVSRPAAEAVEVASAIASGEMTTPESDSPPLTRARGPSRAWAISLSVVVLSLAIVAVRAVLAPGDPAALFGAWESSDAKPPPPRFEAAAPETSGRVQTPNPAVDDRLTDAAESAVGDRLPVLFDGTTGRVSLQLSRTPLYEALMLIGWQTGIRFETDLVLADPVDLVAGDIPLRDALRRLLEGYQFIELVPEAADTPIPRTVWVLARQPGPIRVDRALETLATSSDEALREEAVRELTTLGRSAAGVELLAQVDRVVSVDAAEAGFLADLRRRIEASLCHGPHESSVGPQATALSCD